MSEVWELLPECPFFQKRGQRHIDCEGVEDHSILRQMFTRTRFTEEHYTRYCCSMCFEKCPIGKMLYQKYEEESYG